MSTLTVTTVGATMIVTLPREFDADTVGSLSGHVLRELERASATALVFEASGLDLIDRHEFECLSSVARAATWLGVRAILVGLTPGVVRYLVDHDVDTSAFVTLGSLDDALLATASVAAATDEVDDRADRAPPDEAPS